MFDLFGHRFFEYIYKIPYAKTPITTTPPITVVAIDKPNMPLYASVDSPKNVSA